MRRTHVCRNARRHHDQVNKARDAPGDQQIDGHGDDRRHLEDAAIRGRFAYQPELFGQYLNSNSHMIQQLEGLAKKILK